MRWNIEVLLASGWLTSDAADDSGAA